VIPGIVVTLALRFDILKSIDVEKLSNMFVKEQEGGDVNTMQFLIKKAQTCKKSYFTAIMFGYFFAIIATILVMLIFDAGQPALLYLVPGCILSLVLTSMYNGEFSKLWNFDEDPYITAPGEESDEDEDDKKEGKKQK
jgi:minor histocompatibility antigen H13